MNERTQMLDIVFDGPPGNTPGRFVEVETMEGASTRVGKWIDRGDGTWALRLTAVVREPDPPCAGARDERCHPDVGMCACFDTVLAKRRAGT